MDIEFLTIIPIFSFFSLQNFDLLLLAFAISGIGVLGFTVFFSNRHSVTNISFLLFALVTILWSVTNFFAYKINNQEISFWLFRVVIAIGAWHAFLFFQTFRVFPKESSTLPKWHTYILMPLVFLVSLLNLTPLVFYRIQEVVPGGQITKIQNGPGIALFGSLVLFLVIGGLFMLFRNTKRAHVKEKRTYFIVLLGVSMTFALIMAFNFILPAFFDNPQFIPFGALYIFPFIAFTSYAILRHKLFNVRVSGTMILVFALSVVSFMEVALTDDFSLIIYKIIIFGLTLVFGILLISSVLKEVQLREQIEKMAKEVQKSYEVEKKAKEELEKLDKLKDQFLTQTQHDLRTPLTSIMGYIDLIMNGSYGEQSKQTTEVIKKLRVLSDGMIRKANNFLDLAQFQLGKSAVVLNSKVQIFKILEEIKNELDFKAQSKGIYLNLEKPQKDFIVKADKEKLKAAIFNIVDNSVKFTQQGGVTINLKNEGAVKIIISDTGIGINPNKVETIFNTMFERSEQAKKTASGAGVGLYLSTQIIKAHEGKVWAESEGEGMGSTFYIELPALDEVINNDKVNMN